MPKSAVLMFALVLFAATACSEEGPKPMANPAENSADASTNDSESDVNDETSQNTNTSNQGGSSSGLHPRWVLYNAAGDPVEAIVEPFSKDPEVGDVIGFDDPYDCVYLTATDDRDGRWQVPYELETGEISPCVQYILPPYYTTDDCTGQRYGFVDDADRMHYDRVELTWPVGEVQEVSLEAYSWNGDCVENPNPSTTVIPLEPLPVEIENRLHNPPYEVRAEY